MCLLGEGMGERRSGVRMCGVRICGFSEERSIAEGDGRVRRHVERERGDRRVRRSYDL